jgi:hypothetical protein
MSPSGTQTDIPAYHINICNSFNLRREKQRCTTCAYTRISLFMEATSSEAASEPIRFRAGKKRKAYRQRAQEDDDAVAETVQSPPSASAVESNDKPAQKSTPDEGEYGEASVAAALRLRNARRSRLGGVAFRNSNRPEDDTNTERALVPHDADETSNSEPIIKGVTDRFTHQTGKVADLNDRHMYVEAILLSQSALSSTQ